MFCQSGLSVGAPRLFYVGKMTFDFEETIISWRSWRRREFFTVEFQERKTHSVSLGGVVRTTYDVSESACSPHVGMPLFILGGISLATIKL